MKHFKNAILQIYPNLTQGLFKDLCTGCTSQEIEKMVYINFMLSLLFRIIGK